MTTMSAREFDRLRPSDLENKGVLDSIADALRDREQLIESCGRYDDGQFPWRCWTWGAAPSVLREMFGAAVGCLIYEVPMSQAGSFCIAFGRSIVEKHELRGSLIVMVDQPAC